MLRLSVALLLSLPLLARADEIPWPHPRTVTSARKGLEWLATQQQANGSLGTEALPVVRTALAGLAFVASAEERHRERVRKCFEYLVSRQAEDGWIPEPLPEKDRRAMSSGMSGQAFSLLFLATAWRTRAWWWNAEELEASGAKWRSAIERAIRVIESSQNAKGGWGHEPRPTDADTIEESAPVLHALCCAAKAGFEVREETLAAGRKYADALTGDDGETGYSLGNESARAARAFGLTAGGAAVLTGIDPANPKAPRSLKRLQVHAPGRGSNTPSSGDWLFGSLYASLAMFHAGGDDGLECRRSIRDALLKDQRADGRWDHSAPGMLTGPVSATAIAVIELTLPQVPLLKLAPETASDLMRLSEWRIRRNSWSVDVSGELTVTSENREKKQAYAGLLKCTPSGTLKLEGGFAGEAAQDAWKLESDGVNFSMEHGGTLTNGGGGAQPAEFEASLAHRAGHLVVLLTLPYVVRGPGTLTEFPDASDYAPVSSFGLKSRETLLGRPALVLEFTVKVKSRELDLVQTLWIDAETFLPLKRSSTGKMDDLPFSFVENYASATARDPGKEPSLPPK